MKELIQLRKELHQYPEIAHEEKKTAQKIIDFFQELKPDESRTEIGGQGLIFTFQGKKKGKTLLFRSELDGLPIEESNEFSHASKIQGKGHLCGHDGHMAILCGLGKILSKREFKGKVHLLFQPAEEVGEGASQMLGDKKMQSIQPDFAFALHNLPQFKIGHVILKSGVFAAASTGIIFKLKGKPTHASHPKDGINPSFAISQLIHLMHETPQMHTALEEAFQITIVGFNAGQKAFGTSAADGELYATLRAYNNSIMERICQLIEKKSAAIAKQNQLELEISYTEGFAAVNNDEEATRIVEKVCKKLRIKTHPADHPFPWSEDVGEFSKYYPLCLFGLGAGKNQPQLHNQDYDFPDSLIEKGVDIFYQIIETANE